MRKKSCTAAPVGDVMNPTVAGSSGSARFRAASKQSLVRQPFFQRLELALQPAHTVLDHRAHDELILAARLIHAHLAIDHDLQPVAQLHGLPRCIAAEQHRAHLRPGVLQRKIHVAARLRADVRHLAAHPGRAQPALEQRLDPARELADRLHAIVHPAGQRLVPSAHAAGCWLR
jgi:hypothetical protein